MNSIDAPEPRHDVGVLFVHGIGQSRQGETLLNFGGPLCSALGPMLEPAEAGGRANARISAAWLSDPASGTPARAELSIEGARRTDSRSNPTSKWLLAEAWWAESFPTPSYGDIASWSFEALPVTLVSHFDRRFRRAGRGLVRSLRQWRRLSPIAQAMTRVTVEGLSLTLAIAAMPMLLFLVALLLVLALPPFKSTRELAGWLQRAIAATVGDSYVFLRKAMAAATITTVVQQRLEWLAARCRVVVVVAHSQGAAVAHRVLRSTYTAPCDLFVTLGSGLGKLSELERGDLHVRRGHLWAAASGGVCAVMAVAALLWRGWEAGGAPWGLLAQGFRIFLIVALGALAALFLVAFATPADGVMPASSTVRATDTPGPASNEVPAWRTYLQALVFAGAIGICSALLLLPWSTGIGPWGVDESLGLLVAGGLGISFAGIGRWRSVSLFSLDPKRQWQHDRELFAQGYALRNRDRLPWYDFHASADPVSNGPLLDEFDPPYHYATEVVNERSLLFDHTSYWQATDDFVQRVARLLLNQGGLALRPLAYARASSRRRWRVAVLAASRRLVALEALALASLWALEQPPAWLDGVVGQAPEPSADASTWTLAWQSWLPALSPWLLGAAIGVAAWGLLRWAWTAWSTYETTLSFIGRDYQVLPARLVPVIAIPLAGACATAWAWAGLMGVLAVVVLVGALAALLHGAFGQWIQLRSSSGDGSQLDALRQVRWQQRLASALGCDDASGAVDVAKQLRWLDEGAARLGLHEAAHRLKSPNAALELGWLLQAMARKTSDPARAEALGTEALAAFVHGAQLGDSVSAWYAAIMLKDRKQEAQALAMYERAFELGDAMAAHSVGMTLMQAAGTDPARQEKARGFYEEGARRGDKLSARFLAQHYESLSRQDEGEPAMALQRKAVSLYRAAFDLGDAESATQAGRLLRRLGDFPAARRALTMGMRLREAGATLELGHLERHDEQDIEAARRAYRDAIYLDLHGGIAGEALLALGEMLEAEQRPKAAMLRYREVLRLDGVAAQARAQAGLRLSRLLSTNGEPWRDRDEALRLLQVAAREAPQVASDAYVDALVERADHVAIESMTGGDLSIFSSQALVKLAEFLRFSNEARSRTLLERVIRPDVAWGETAARAYANLLSWHVPSEEVVDALIDQAAARGRHMVDLVADLLESEGRTDLALRMRERAERPQAHPEPPTS